MVRVPPWEVGNMSMKERSSNQHIDGFPNTPRSGGAVINGLVSEVHSLIERKTCAYGLACVLKLLT